jgi:phospholipase/carboxylesterase
VTLNPHGTQPIVAAGTPLAHAAGAIILLHGRGASAQDILGLGAEIAPEGWAMLAPAAAGHTWYPYSFLSPREQNEPFLTSALGRVQAALDAALTAGIPTEKIVVSGFSQGACLATEFVGRNPRRYGALVAFTGGLVGPLDVPITLTGDLAGTPVHLSSGDPDPHVPWVRVQQSGELLQQIGGRVTLQRHPGRPHTIGADEIRAANELLAAL